MPVPATFSRFSCFFRFFFFAVCSVPSYVSCSAATHCAYSNPRIYSEHTHKHSHTHNTHTLTHSHTHNTHTTFTGIPKQKMSHIFRIKNVSYMKENHVCRRGDREEFYIECNLRHYSVQQGVQIPCARPPSRLNSVRWRLIFVGPPVWNFVGRVA